MERRHTRSTTMHDAEQLILTAKPDEGSLDAGAAKKFKRKGYEREMHKL